MSFDRLFGIRLEKSMRSTYVFNAILFSKITQLVCKWVKYATILRKLLLTEEQINA